MNRATTIKPIPSELPDATVPMRLMVLCLTLGDLTNYMNFFCPQRRCQVCQAWADLQSWFWKHPQNTKNN